jgi:DNA mismatch endonuclease, patch repair protein
MVDNISKEERSRIMGLVKQKNTRPEMIVRSFLHSRGLRYRLHDKSLPGKPDLVFTKYRTVVLVHGCFWHGHKDPLCKLARTPKSKIQFWTSKVILNSERDIRNTKALEALGWRVLIIWECEVSKQGSLESLYTAIKN